MFLLLPVFACHSDPDQGRMAKNPRILLLLPLSTRFTAWRSSLACCGKFCFHQCTRAFRGEGINQRNRHQPDKEKALDLTTGSVAGIEEEVGGSEDQAQQCKYWKETGDLPGRVDREAEGHAFTRMPTKLSIRGARARVQSLRKWSLLLLKMVVAFALRRERRALALRQIITNARGF